MDHFDKQLQEDLISKPWGLEGGTFPLEMFDLNSDRISRGWNHVVQSAQNLQKIEHTC